MKSDKENNEQASDEISNMVVCKYLDGDGIAITHANVEELASEFMRYVKAEARRAVVVENGYAERMKDCLLQLVKAPDELIVGGNEHCALIIEMHWVRPDRFTLNLENCVATDGVGMNGDLVSIINEEMKERTLTNIETARDRVIAAFEQRGKNPSGDALSEGVRSMLDDSDSGLDVEQYCVDMDFRPHDAGVDSDVINADLHAFLAGENLLANHLRYNFAKEMEEAMARKVTNA